MKKRTSNAVHLLTPRGFIVSVLLIAGVATAMAAQQPSRLLGKINLHGWIDDVPGLPTSLEEAAAQKDAATKGAGFYQPFYDKVEAFKKSNKQEIAARTKLDEIAMRKAAETQARSNLAQANSLPAIAGMGGLDKLALMTPEQRAQAAQLMQQNMRQNPVAPAGSPAGMDALMKKIMNDPAYGARYAKMSQTEKDAELRRFMAGDPASAFVSAQEMPVGQRPPSPRVQAGNDVAMTMAIRSDLARMIQARGALDTAFSEKDLAITNSTGSHRQINDEASATLAKIPLVNDSIMGRVHDLEMEAALNKETATRHRDRAAGELQQRTALVNDRKRELKALASDYQNWLKANLDKINTSTAPADLLRNANTEIEVAGYEQSFVDAAEELAKYSEFVTKDVASYEERYRQGSGAIRATRSK